MTDATIRALEASDFEQWHHLWQHYLAFYRATLPRALIEETWCRLVGDDDTVQGLVAVAETGRLVGLAHFIFHPSTWSVSPYCYLEDLFVAPSVRGGDIAPQLIEATAKAAKKRDCKRLYWQTQEYNGAARSLYDTLADRTSFVSYRKRGMA